LSIMFANRSLASDTYVGQIIDLDDPERLGRARVRVYGFTDGMEPEDHPWAVLQLGLGAGVNRGHAPAMAVDDYVQVRFQNGDSRYPVILSSALVAVDREVHLPAIAVDGPRSTAGIRTTPTELPTSQSRGVPYLTDEVDLQHDILKQTRANRSYRIAHMSQGSQFEMTSQGSICLHSPQAIWMSSSADLQERFSQKTSKGLHTTTELTGDYKLSAARLELSSIAPMELEIGGAFTVNSLSTSISSLDSMSLTTTGQLGVIAGFGIDLFSGRDISMRSGAGNIDAVTTAGIVTLQATDIGPKLELHPLEGFALQTPLVSATGSLIGDFKVAGPTSKLELSAQGEVALKSPMSELTMEITGETELKNQMSSVTLTSRGTVEVKNSAESLGSIMRDLLISLQALTVQTGTGASSPPNNVAELQAISRRLQQLLGL